MPDDITALFPQLAAQLENWDGRRSADDGSGDPSHAGVTDDDIERYLQSIGSLRAPLSPLVEGQVLPPIPEFANNGRPVPSGPSSQAVVEEPEPSPEPAPEPAPAPVEPAPAPPPQEEGETPPTPPPPPPPTPTDYLIAGRTVPRSLAESWATFDSYLSTDADLRNLIAAHIAQRASGQAPASPAAPTPLGPQVPPVPDLPPEYADDPAYKSLHETLLQQRAVLDRLSRQSAQAIELSTANTTRTYNDIVTGVVSSFKTSRGLDDATMNNVRMAAARSGLAEKYMSGFNPLTGETVTPDPYKATELALEVAYFTLPETRRIETDKEISRRAAQAASDRTRKQKLAGVAGSGGSVPRAKKEPKAGERWQEAASDEVREMLAGSWNGGE